MKCNRTTVFFINPDSSEAARIVNLEPPEMEHVGFDAVKCDKCGSSLTVGDWPFCPHGPAGRFGEDPLTPYYDGELDAEVRTRGERRRLMREKGLEYHDVSRKKRGKVYVCLGS